MNISSCAHAFEELAKWTVLSFVGCSYGIRNLKISEATTFRPSVKLSWMDLYFEVYGTQQEIENWMLHLVDILMQTDGFEPPGTLG
jgi:hypothetical protein